MITTVFLLLFCIVACCYFTPNAFEYEVEGIDGRKEYFISYYSEKLANKLRKPKIYARDLGDGVHLLEVQIIPNQYTKTTDKGFKYGVHMCYLNVLLEDDIWRNRKIFNDHEVVDNSSQLAKKFLSRKYMYSPVIISAEYPYSHILAENPGAFGFYKGYLIQNRQDSEGKGSGAISTFRPYYWSLAPGSGWLDNALYLSFKEGCSSLYKVFKSPTHHAFVAPRKKVPTNPIQYALAWIPYKWRLWSEPTLPFGKKDIWHNGWFEHIDFPAAMEKKRCE